MPIAHNISHRRSRRFSTHELISDEEDWECPGELLYPDSPIVSPAPQIPSVTNAPARTSHARQRPDDHIPRPPNSFICFRSDYCAVLDGTVPNHRVVSKLAGQAWAELDSIERKKYKDIAQEKKRLHAIKYPDYAYAPSARPSGKSKKRKADDDCDYEDRRPHPKRRRSRGGRSLKVVVGGGYDSDGPISPTNCGRKRARPALTETPSPLIARSQTPELALNTPSESSDPAPVLRTPLLLSQASQLVCNYDDDDDDGFVPTGDIPPLDLYACAPSKKSLEVAADYSVGLAMQAPFKTEISKQTCDETMWYSPDGTFKGTAPVASTSSPSFGVADLRYPSIDFSEVEFDAPATSPPASTDDIHCPKPINFAKAQFTNLNPFGIELDFDDWLHMDQLQ
ncbi:hypothetical protein B0H15DRAFT_329691 [Mycena belliarum]|uniref:HMG box domain-containing protein n=1 Tax=Mycena belliarum TaxID=1033014 RepID=A0AAD6UHB5_9AGAR|nr:hypothetical protein B0H15DRAFT_329691 [Mycena belliae]